MSILPNIVWDEDDVARLNSHKKNTYCNISNIPFGKVRSSFGIVLHMHQPTIPAETGDIRSSKLISNLQYMMEHQDIGDNHNAPIFLKCYSRMSDFVRELVREDRNPRVMLDYSGNLLWGLKQMGEERVLENLALVTKERRYHRYVEWLGTMWSHAVVTSTPVPDIKLHMMAWRHHFASIFGIDAARRVKGFSPPEMHLPIHPDVCFEYVKAIKECGYQWLVVQEHSIENIDGSHIRKPHLPHRLVAKNSAGKTEEITILIKTKGSDSKLIGQMQPYYEAKTLKREAYGGKSIPPFVIQVGDGENGGVMMNEFPDAYKKAFHEIERTDEVVSMSGSEYLEFLKEAGVEEDSFIPVQPFSQHRIWELVKDFHPGACDDAINEIKSRDRGYNLDKGSWTNDRSWVKGYEDVLDPINRLSVAFHRKYDKKINKDDHTYHEALLLLLLSQTSCFRYWGAGNWTDYAKEIVRRGMEVVS